MGILRVTSVGLECDACGRIFHGSPGQGVDDLIRFAEIIGWTFPVTGSIFCFEEGATGSKGRAS